MCVFSETSMSRHHNVFLQHTHMTGQPWLAGQVGPEEIFSGFAKFFGPHVVSKKFFDRQGVTQHTKILSLES